MGNIHYVELTLIVFPLPAIFDSLFIMDKQCVCAVKIVTESPLAKDLCMLQLLLLLLASMHSLQACIN